MRRRILSIQGGGVNGIFAARLLELIEERLRDEGRPANAGAYFDLIAGTSTGGLIALGLAMRLPSSQIVDLYRRKSEQIFPSKGLVSKALGYLFKKPWYDSAPLIAELKQVFGDRKLGEASSRVLIPTYRPGHGVRVFKTAHHVNFKNDFKILARDIAAATAAAPMFFKPHRMEDGGLHVDGGVWANNPSLLAVAESIHYLGWERTKLDVLSIFGVQDLVPAKSWSRLEALPGALLQAQVKASIAAAKTLIGDVGSPESEHGNLISFVETMSPGAFALDSARSVAEVASFADDQFMRRGDQIMNFFFSQVADPFECSLNAIDT